MIFPELKIILGIIGRISSGKSTVAKRLAKHYNAEIISFGRYLVNYSKNKGLPVDRKSLQELGDSFIKSDAKGFLSNVMQDQISSSTSAVIIEGIRHKNIFNAIKDQSNTAIFAFIDVPVEIRHQRYRSRLKESDEPVSMEKFIEIDTHPVEAEIDSLKMLCNIMLESDLTNDDLFQRFDKKLN